MTSLGRKRRFARIIASKESKTEAIRRFTGMKEGGWHQKVREELLYRLKETEARVESSHGVNPNLELFRGNLRRPNCLSDADLIVFDSDEKIIKIIEIESELNPKKISGVVMATHLCTLCRVKKEEDPYQLTNVLLEIIYKKPKVKSQKEAKLAVMYGPLLEMVKNSKGGCLSSFRWEAHE